LFPSESERIIVVVPEENLELESQYQEQNLQSSVAGTPSRRKTKKIHKDSTKSKENRPS
jgi:hypothetical protein